MRRIHVPRGVVHNLFALYGLYCSNYILALVTVPYLIRILGLAGWGTVAFVQAFAGYLLQVADFGFAYSATREVSRRRESKSELSEIMAGALGAKAILALACLAIAYIAQSCVEMFRAHPLLFWAGIAWAIAQGSGVMWYFQGHERMRTAVSIDLTCRAAAVVGIFALVRSPGDAWKVLALQACGSGISLACCLTLAMSEIPFRRPTLRLAVGTLRRGVHTFAPRNASVLFTVGNAFILGLFAPPQVVGYYAGADRISRAVAGLLGPATDAVYPRVARMVTQSKSAIWRVARINIVALSGVGLAMGAGLFALAPQLVRILMGGDYQTSVYLVRVFALIPPLVAVRNVLGAHWMLPLNLDRTLNIIVLGACLLNVGLAAFLSFRYSAAGTAWAGVISQAAAAAAIYGSLRWMRLDPMGPAPALEGRGEDYALRYGETLTK